jgi:hypothetical protein
VRLLPEPIGGQEVSRQAGADTSAAR